MRGIAKLEVDKLHLPTLGIVTSIFPHSNDNDKDNYECNIRLKYSDIELRKVPFATQCIGLAGIPRIGDLVLLVFINGDINAPIAVGRLYNDEDRPPHNSAEEIIYIPPYKPNAAVRRVYLEFPQDVTQDQKMILQIKDERFDINAGKTKILVTKNGDVTVESEANITFVAKGDTSIKATGNISISGDNVKVESKQDMKLESGNTLKIQSTADAEISGSSAINIEAKSKMKLKGSTVNIN
jgi:uncharacterized protein involved in type VI secretion and phage assembly